MMPSIPQLLIILLIIILLFGAKRLRNIGSDLGSAVKGFKKSMREEDEKIEEQKTEEGRVIEGETTKEKSEK